MKTFCHFCATFWLQQTCEWQWMTVNCAIRVCSLQWRHNERDGVSNQSHDCLPNRLLKAQIKENIKAPRHSFLYTYREILRYLVWRIFVNFKDIFIEILFWWSLNGDTSLVFAMAWGRSVENPQTHWGRDKWTPFSRRHFQMHFFLMKMY